jgi:hypothetical protein
LLTWASAWVRFLSCSSISLNRTSRFFIGHAFKRISVRLVTQALLDQVLVVSECARLRTYSHRVERSHHRKAALQALATKWADATEIGECS